MIRKALLIGFVLVASSSLAEATCGERGGPGYRGPDGKCLSWKDLGSKCGSPPTTRCSPENVAPDAGGGAQKGDEIEKFKERQHEQMKKRQHER